MMDILYTFKVQNGEASLASQLFVFIKNLIVSGALKDGDKLPNEAELSEIFKISRMTVREAVMNLVQQDMLYRHVGRGTFVKARNTAPRILWVCGKNIASGDISPYYSSELRLFSKECAVRGWQVDPVWIGGGDESAINAYLPSKNSNYAGYLFLSMDFSHPLLKAVDKENLPYAHITSPVGRSRFVSPDIEQGVRLGLDHLKKENPGAKQITMFCHKIHENRINSLLDSIVDIRVKAVFCDPSSIMSEAIPQSCELMKKIIAEGSDWSSLFIMDDVMALGASEAILKSGSKKSKDVHMLVTSGGSLQIPFINPVTYLYYDIEAEALAAVNILDDQISGRNPVPAGCFGKFKLIDAISEIRRTA